MSVENFKKAALERVLDITDGPFGLAKLLGYKPARVTNWRMRGYVPSDEVVSVATAVDHRVSVLALLGQECVSGVASSDSTRAASA